MAQEEEVLGKAYDSRLMERLLTYLRPYGWQVAIALVSILLKSFADVLGPYLTKVAIDRYLAPVKAYFVGFLELAQPATAHGHRSDRRRSMLGLLVFSFLLEFLQTYFMQWTGQKVMFDLRSQIFRHLQRMHIAFYDKNPVGRLVTRVTTDVDALNEMFTSGVVSIFEDIFVLIGILGVMLCMNWKLALITFAVLPFIVVRDQDLPRQSARFLPANSDRHRPHQFVSARARQRHGRAAALQPRERKAYKRFSEINRSHMDAYKDAIMAHAVYYPVVEILLRDRDRLRDLVWRAAM